MFSYSKIIDFFKQRIETDDTPYAGEFHAADAQLHIIKLQAVAMRNDTQLRFCNNDLHAFENKLYTKEELYWVTLGDAYGLTADARISALAKNDSLAAKVHDELEQGKIQFQEWNFDYDERFDALYYWLEENEHNKTILDQVLNRSLCKQSYLSLLSQKEVLQHTYKNKQFFSLIR